ncbi:alpha-galactosidase [Massiliimalia massiliensis]|uniref:alpha-galactosidase n=1 Tax=Massiliimalia massiliensis TaxID=1852384 RepID=UPI000984C6E5|nr:alpha-galactosidase [Massiliimalia massiliensis]
MPIIYHETTQTFHLYNNKISYLFKILKNGQLGQLYFGKRIHDKENFDYLLELFPRAMSACAYEGDKTFSLEHIKQEYPAYGTGDMRYPAYEILQTNGSHITSFAYVSHEIRPGKPALPGLPATYAEREEEAETLAVHLWDEVIHTDLILFYTIFEQHPAIARSASFTCRQEEPIVIHRAMSLSLDFPDYDFEMIELTGAWARERSVKCRPLEHGVQGIYSMRGCSGNGFNPFLALKRPNTDEASGEVYGFSLVYSGNFLAQADVEPFGTARVTMGIHPDRFSWKLCNGESFQTPEAVTVYSDQGLNGMSQAYHTLYRSRLARGFWRDRTRPILINNWEATYFDFNEDRIIQIAKAAQQLGVELFVLDDGWYGKRSSDTTSLGDWYPNPEKLPNGLSGLAGKIQALGMKFGLWIEPEMVSYDSDLYRAHPDWMLAAPGRRSSHGRNQYVLDFSKKEVVDYLFHLLDRIFSEAPVSYIKWDMNRCMTEVFSQGAGPDYQGTVPHRYILGVYDLYQRLTDKYPEILFESCASGGARFDPGMLYYAPQCWASDDTDAVERIKIQYGTSMVYPLSSIGAHVSAVPNHQLLRNTPLQTRANVAYFGTFGYELDLNQLSERETEMVKEQVSFMKQHRELIQYGDFYRLISPFEGDGNRTSWMVVSKDRKTALVAYYRILRQMNGGYSRIRLQGLDPQSCYTVSPSNISQYGDELMNLGLLTSDINSGEFYSHDLEKDGDYASRLYLLTAE